jgi:uncharacterized protein (TIGR02996 family)
VIAEDDFQAALDANPDDWQTRLVFADWLDERDDPRAAGYRALGVRRLRPNKWVKRSKRVHWWWGSDKYFWKGHPDVVILPAYWFKALPEPGYDGVAWPSHDRPNGRREAENAAALAFAALSQKRQAQLLTPPASAGKKKPRRRAR